MSMCLWTTITVRSHRADNLGALDRHDAGPYHVKPEAVRAFIPPSPTEWTPLPVGAAYLLSRRDRGRRVHRRWMRSMRNYELMVILDPDLEERTVQPSL